MRCCCPAGHGCNAPDGGEPCALDLCRAAAGRERDAALALERWSIFQRTCEQQRGASEQRFRRRAFERARDGALVALALSPESARVVRARGMASLAVGRGIAGSSLRRALRGARKARADGAAGSWDQRL